MASVTRMVASIAKHVFNPNKTDSATTQPSQPNTSSAKNTRDSDIIRDDSSSDESDVANAGSDRANAQLQPVHTADLDSVERAYLAGLHGIKEMNLDKDLELEAASDLGRRFAKKYGQEAVSHLRTRVGDGLRDNLANNRTITPKNKE